MNVQDVYNAFAVCLLTFLKTTEAQKSPKNSTISNKTRTFRFVASVVLKPTKVLVATTLSMMFSKSFVCWAWGLEKYFLLLMEIFCSVERYQREVCSNISLTLCPTTVYTVWNRQHTKKKGTRDTVFNLLELHDLLPLSFLNGSELHSGVVHIPALMAFPCLSRMWWSSHALKIRKSNRNFWYIKSCAQDT